MCCDSIGKMSIDDSLPTDLASAHALIMARNAGCGTGASHGAGNEAQYRALSIEKLKHTIRKPRHERFGQSSERGALLEQLELQLAEPDGRYPYLSLSDLSSALIIGLSPQSVDLTRRISATIPHFRCDQKSSVGATL